MEIVTMGKVIVPATLENIEDLWKSESGEISRDDVRRIEVQDALVDTGAMMLSMPKRMIAQLGLRPFRKRTVRTVGGIVEITLYSGVRLTVQGREFNGDVAEIPDDCPVLIGLIGNPEHNGEHMIDIF
jgi:predicted aspartyl protease